MAIKISNKLIEFDHPKIMLLHWGQILFCSLMFLHKQFNLEFSLLGFLCFFFFQFYYFQTARKLFYTFWTFSLIQFFFLIFYALIYSSHSLIVLSSCLALIFLLLEAYTLNGPIYYPLIRWWEYDFRFRNDFFAKILEEEARVTDIRKYSGCILSFQEFSPGETFSVEIFGNENEVFLFGAEIVSKRYTSLGRPIKYGVRFILKSEEDRDNFERLKNVWKESFKMKASQKFDYEKS